MKPPISYYGGKQRIASKIVPLIPKHTVYVEPFAGGAAVMFKKPWPDVTNNDHYREVLNDTDGRLINFYRQLRDNGPALVEKLKLTLFSEEEHQIAKDLETGDDLERARRYFVRIQQSFSNNLNAGWRRAVYGRNLCATWANQVNRLPEYLDRMQSVQIANTDALTCIQQFDSPQTFFYCDPPYPGAYQGHYKGYTTKDFEALVEALNNIQGSFLLSCYDVGIEVPDHWERFDFSTTCHAKGRDGYDRTKKMDETKQNRKRTEVVYRHISQIPVRKEIQALYDSGKFDCFTGNPQHPILHLTKQLHERFLPALPNIPRCSNLNTNTNHLVIHILNGVKQ